MYALVASSIGADRGELQLNACAAGTTRGDGMPSLVEVDARSVGGRAAVATYSQEDPDHDLRLALVDLDLVADDVAVLLIGDSGTVWIAERRRCRSRESRERATFETAQRLVAKVVEVQVREQALDRERELRVLRAGVDAVGDAEQRNVRIELELLEDEIAESAMSREMRDMSSVRMHVDLAARRLLRIIASRLPARSRLEPEIAKSGIDLRLLRIAAVRRAMKSRQRRTWSSMLRSFWRLEEKRA